MRKVKCWMVKEPLPVMSEEEIQMHLTEMGPLTTEERVECESRLRETEIERLFGDDERGKESAEQWAKQIGAPAPELKEYDWPEDDF